MYRLTALGIAYDVGASDEIKTYLKNAGGKYIRKPYLDFITETMDEFTVIGFEREFAFDQGYQLIPKYWDEITQISNPVLFQGKKPETEIEKAIPTDVSIIEDQGKLELMLEHDGNVLAINDTPNQFLQRRLDKPSRVITGQDLENLEGE